MRVSPISKTSPDSVMRKTAPRIRMKGLSYSMFDRLAGLARSLAIYHAIPFRQRRLRRLYRTFVKHDDLVLDVEGSEPAALAGLSHAVPALAFEYLPRALDRVEACVDRLRTLGHYVYNVSPGESYRFASETWLEGPQLLDSLRRPEAQQRSG